MHRLGLLLILLLPAVPCAAADLHLTGAPPLYRLEASGFNRVAAIDITITYDPATLRVEAMEIGPFLQGALTAGNIKNSGKARLGAVTTSALSGSGLLATLKVKTLGGATPSLNVEATLRDLDGKHLPVGIDAPINPVTSPAMPEQLTPVPVTTPESEPARLSSRTSVTITPRSIMPLYPRESGQTPPAPIPLPPATAAADRPSVTSPRAASAEKPEFGAGAPFDLFRRTFASFQTLDDLAQLCALPHGMRQDPCPVLSNGKDRVVLRVEDSRQQASFGVKGARLLESWRKKDGTLNVELLPTAGVGEVNVIIVDELLRDIRLVVAPPVKLDPQRSIEDHLTHWQDLNGDGIITYEEAWSIAMNLLAGRSLGDHPGAQGIMNGSVSSFPALRSAAHESALTPKSSD